MAYSKEAERQNKALADLMAGKEHEKEYELFYVKDDQQNARSPWSRPNGSVDRRTGEPSAQSNIRKV